MELIAIQFLSVRVPSGRIVTLHSGNHIADLEDADAQWLLREYPDRVAPIVELELPTLSADKPSADDPLVGADSALETPAEKPKRKKS
jgi:hypothetical protein